MGKFRQQTRRSQEPIVHIRIHGIVMSLILLALHHIRKSVLRRGQMPRTGSKPLLAQSTPDWLCVLPLKTRNSAPVLMIVSVFHELPSLLEVPSLLPHPRGNVGTVLILSFSHSFPSPLCPPFLFLFRRIVSRIRQPEVKHLLLTGSWVTTSCLWAASSLSWNSVLRGRSYVPVVGVAEGHGCDALSSVPITF